MLGSRSRHGLKKRDMVKVKHEKPRGIISAQAAEGLAAALPASAEVVLLGSVASDKYVEPLLAVFGRRLLFPAAFVGRGDMSRGGLMLRAAQDGLELAYAPVEGAVRHGPRPPRLAPRGRRRG